MSLMKFETLAYRLGPICSLLVGGILCAGAFASSAQAATINIVGTPGSVQLGTTSGKNNVENNTGPNLPASYGGFEGPSDGSGWYFNASLFATIPNYTVTWYFLGAESGYQNTLSSGAPLFSLTELNQNNNCTDCGSIGNSAGIYDSLTPFAVTTSSLSLIPITLTTNQDPAFVANNGDANGLATLIFAYVMPKTEGKPGWKLSPTQTDWFAFGWNDDKGAIDKDYDDFMVVGYVAPVPGPLAGAGLPGLALTLGGFIAWSKRRKAAAALRA